MTKSKREHTLHHVEIEEWVGIQVF